MSKFSSIEDSLRQLIPSSLSEDGIQRMDAVIEDLSKDGVAALKGGRGRAWYLLWRAAAIVILLLLPATLFYIYQDETGVSGVASVGVANDMLDSELELVKTTNHLTETQDDGLIIPDDGGVPHHRLRYYIVDEEQLRDSKTGVEVVVRQPRYEIVTIPVTLF